MAFKMKGSPMQRNFGVGASEVESLTNEGSPLQQNELTGREKRKLRKARKKITKAKTLLDSSNIDDQEKASKKLRKASKKIRKVKGDSPEKSELQKDLGSFFYRT